MRHVEFLEHDRHRHAVREAAQPQSLDHAVGHLKILCDLGQAARERRVEARGAAVLFGRFLEADKLDENLSRADERRAERRDEPRRADGVLV